MMEYGHVILADVLIQQVQTCMPFASAFHDEERFIGLVPEGAVAKPSGQQLLRRISRRVVGWA